MRGVPIPAPDRRPTPSLSSETAYDTDYQNVRFITLNASTHDARELMTPPDLPPCSTGGPDPQKLWLDLQARWLDHILQNNPNKWSVATFHQPVFSAAVGRDEKPIRDAWLPVFQRNDIDLVLMGHDHVYARGYVNADAATGRSSAPSGTTRRRRTRRWGRPWTRSRSRRATRA